MQGDDETSGDAEANAASAAAVADLDVAADNGPDEQVADSAGTTDGTEGTAPSDFEAVVGSALSGALAKKGFTELTSVQRAVLDPALAERDLRITSQTGSGKTVAVGLVLRGLVEATTRTQDGIARPCALIVTPTRELAKQVEAELRWLFAPLGARIASATGGASYRVELRAMATSPAVVVGTPGRLLDHLRRGAIDLSSTAAVVLDEADRMLDMGFREELEAILALAPTERRTHLMSATFPRDVQALANRVQRDPVHVQGTLLGAANVDIDHVVHLIDRSQRVDAIVNLLLAHPDEEMLVFARTRAEVAEIAAELLQAGFPVASLSGELEQAARDRALSAFRRGALRALVATDVAARGIDVQGVARVIHAVVTTDVDSYTHRSGRTGRAGHKGTSSVLVTTATLRRTMALLQAAGLTARHEPIPNAAAIEDARDEALFAQLTAQAPEGETEPEPRTRILAERLAAAADPTQVIARLVARARSAGVTRPRELQEVPWPTARARRREAPNERPRGGPGYEAARPGTRSFSGPPGRRGEARSLDENWVGFRVSWGAENGADPRRLLAMVCRRGDIRGHAVGPIMVAAHHSIIGVHASVAERFAAVTRAPDPRDPGISIRPERGSAAGGERPSPRRQPPREPPQNAPRRPPLREPPQNAPRRPPLREPPKNAPREHAPRARACDEGRPPRDDNRSVRPGDDDNRRVRPNRPDTRTPRPRADDTRPVRPGAGETRPVRPGAPRKRPSPSDAREADTGGAALPRRLPPTKPKHVKKPKRPKKPKRVT